MRTEHGRIIVGETCIDARVQEGFLRKVEMLIAEARWQIESKIRTDPFFGLTYEPCAPSRYDDTVVEWMCSASMTAGVGPMAAVAGAIDRYVAESLAADGCENLILDNDGDVAMMCNDPVKVLIYPGDKALPLMSATLEPEGSMLSICTSSGRIGHSISLGDCSIASVVSRDPALADACATRLGNLCKGPIDLAVEDVGSIIGVQGCLVADRDCVAIFGDFPLEGLMRSILAPYGPWKRLQASAGPQPIEYRIIRYRSAISKGIPRRSESRAG